MRIFLIGLSEDFARSLARYLNGNTRVALVGAVPSLALAGLLLPATQATVALLDWSLFAVSPYGSVRALRQGQPALRIVCVTHEAAAYRAVALAAGADAVISKDAFAEELEPLLRSFLGEDGGTHGGRDE